jgi:hypothetical protein
LDSSDGVSLKISAGKVFKPLDYDEETHVLLKIKATGINRAEIL